MCIIGLQHLQALLSTSSSTDTPACSRMCYVKLSRHLRNMSENGCMSLASAHLTVTDALPAVLSTSTSARTGCWPPAGRAWK